jgi:hypothetical protein
MSNITYQIEGPVYIIWMHWAHEKDHSNILPKTYKTKAEAVKEVQQWIFDDQIASHGSEDVS